MPLFSYLAQNRSGVPESGTIEAADRDAAATALQRQDLTVFTLEESLKASAHAWAEAFASGPSPADLVEFCRDMSMLLQGGVPILIALSLQGRKAANPMMREALGCVVASVSEGKALSSAMAAKNEVFPNLLVAMVQVGENAGTLDKVLSQYALDVERSDEVRRKVRSASIYPLMVMAVASGVVFFLCFKVIPTFAGIFKSFHLKLPWMTLMVMAFAMFVHDHALALVVGAVICYLALDFFFETPTGVAFLARLRRVLPGFKQVFNHAMQERFFRTLSLLINSGVPIVRALVILENAFASDPPFQAGIRSMMDSITRGGRISSSMRATGLFADSALCGIEVGEESGRLNESLDNLARYHNQRLNEMARDLGVIIEPVMILGVGAVIAVVLLSLFLPMLELSSMRPM